MLTSSFLPPISGMYQDLRFWLTIKMLWMPLPRKNSGWMCNFDGAITIPTMSKGNLILIYLSTLDTFQDFLIKLDIKPLIHLLEISIFSLNNDIVRVTKIMNNLVKVYKIHTFKVIFQCLKLVESFRKTKIL